MTTPRFICRSISWDLNADPEEKATEIQDLMNDLAAQGYDLVDLKAMLFVASERARPAQVVLLVMEKRGPGPP